MEKQNVWIVFSYQDRELCAITLDGTFIGEVIETKKLLAGENNISYSDIDVTIQERKSL